MKVHKWNDGLPRGCQTEAKESKANITNPQNKTKSDPGALRARAPPGKIPVKQKTRGVDHGEAMHTWMTQQAILKAIPIFPILDNPVFLSLDIPVFPILGACTEGLRHPNPLHLGWNIVTKERHIYYCRYTLLLIRRSDKQIPKIYVYIHVYTCICVS